MNRGLRGVAFVAAIALVGFAVYRVEMRLSSLRIPTMVTRTDDPHRAISNSLDARLDRLLHDPAPAAAANRKLIALTFDDGPFPVESALLLDILADYGVRATFFVVGERVLQYPQLAERMAREGHEVANHTLTHPAHFEALDRRQVTAELSDGANAIERYVSDPAIRTMMRPPHGRYTEDTVRATQRAGYQMILWTDDPGDWRAVAPQRLIDHIERDASEPDILLLHSGRLATVEFMPEIIGRFRKAGFTFVTVGEMLRRLPVTVIDHPVRTPLD